MNETERITAEMEVKKGKIARVFENFFLMGGWILVLIAVLAACGVIRTLFNY